METVVEQRNVHAHWTLKETTRIKRNLQGKVCLKKEEETRSHCADCADHLPFVKCVVVHETPVKTFVWYRLGSCFAQHNSRWWRSWNSLRFLFARPRSFNPLSSIRKMFAMKQLKSLIAHSSCLKPFHHAKLRSEMKFFNMTLCIKQKFSS